MARKDTNLPNRSSVDDFIKSKTSQIGMNSPTRLPPALKKTRGRDGSASGSKPDQPELNPDGSPRKRKNPHRVARPASKQDAVMQPPSINRPETLAESEKPPELTEAEKRVRRLMEKREEQRKREDRAARKEIRKLEKAEKKKRKELEALEDAAADARLAEEAAAAAKAEQEIVEARQAREARRAAKEKKKMRELEEKQREADMEEQRVKSIANQRQTEDMEEDGELDQELPAGDEEEDGITSENEIPGSTDYLDAASKATDDDTVSVRNKRWKFRRV